MTAAHEYFMDLALREAEKGVAEGNKPVGALIVLDGVVIGTGRNTVDRERDPTNHAEIVAIRAACRTQKSETLAGATLYSTMEPCPMCLWALHIAGINQLVLGGRHASMQRPDLGDYSVEKLLSLTRQQLDLVTGVRTRECEDTRRAWRKQTGRL
jgi:tRNA(Arg) A34 adenosine deaminase TadA